MSIKYYLLVTDSLHIKNINQIQNNLMKLIVAEDLRYRQKEEWKNISKACNIDYYNVTIDGPLRLNTIIE